mgnify:CR=1 FL=1
MSDPAERRARPGTDDLDLTSYTENPTRFPVVHRAIFEARHTEGAQIRDEAVLRDLLTAHGVDADAVFAEVATGKPLDIVRDEHTSSVDDLDVWGVPTFMAGGRAARRGW